MNFAIHNINDIKLRKWNKTTVNYREHDITTVLGLRMAKYFPFFFEFFLPSVS